MRLRPGSTSFTALAGSVSLGRGLLPVRRRRGFAPRRVLVVVASLRRDSAPPRRAGRHRLRPAGIRARGPGRQPPPHRFAPAAIIAPPCCSQSTSATPRRTSACSATTSSWSIGALRRPASPPPTSSPWCSSNLLGLRDLRAGGRGRRDRVLGGADARPRVRAGDRALPRGRGALVGPWLHRDADPHRPPAGAGRRPPRQRRGRLRPRRRRLHLRRLRDRDQLRRRLVAPASTWAV